MRLIDADALKKKLFVFDMEFHDGHHQKYYVYKEKDVDDAPTIPTQKCCLTSEEIETIRIHMNAQKERLCNQWRYNEAEYYQTIVDKLANFYPNCDEER